MDYFSSFIYFTAFLILLYLLRKYVKGKKATRKPMKNKIVIITGASDGIGKETAIQLLEDGAKVILACRDEKKTQGVLAEISKKPFGKELIANATYIHLDLSSFKSVDKFTAEFKSRFTQVDILVNNAGYAASKFELTEDGIEKMIQTNHYSHVKLTLNLLDYFNKQEGRVINVSSIAHNFSNYKDRLFKSFTKDQDQFKDLMYIPMNNIPYGNTKLANIYFTQYLTDLFSSDKRYSHLHSYSLHPGVINSNFVDYQMKESIFFKYLFKFLYPILIFFLKTSNDGAQTQLFLCYSDSKDLKDGGFYNNCAIGTISQNAKNEQMKEYLMKETLKVINNK